jgi:hypothetical protein
MGCSFDLDPHGAEIEGQTRGASLPLGAGSAAAVGELHALAAAARHGE